MVGTPDEQYLYLPDVLPTAYQAAAFADTPRDGTLAVLGLGPVGQMATRIARELGIDRVIGVDGVAERRSETELLDRGIQLRMGQAHVHRWISDLMPMISDAAGPLGTRSLATHHLPLERAPDGYQMFRDKADGRIKVVLQP